MKLFDAALTDIAYEVARRTSGKLPHDSCATFDKGVFEIQPWKRVHNRCLLQSLEFSQGPNRQRRHRRLRSRGQSRAA